MKTASTLCHSESSSGFSSQCATALDSSRLFLSHEMQYKNWADIKSLDCLMILSITDLKDTAAQILGLCKHKIINSGYNHSVSDIL